MKKVEYVTNKIIIWTAVVVATVSPIFYGYFLVSLGLYFESEVASSLVRSAGFILCPLISGEVLIMICIMGMLYLLEKNGFDPWVDKDDKLQIEKEAVIRAFVLKFMLTGFLESTIQSLAHAACFDRHWNKLVFSMRDEYVDTLSWVGTCPVRLYFATTNSITILPKWEDEKSFVLQFFQILVEISEMYSSPEDACTQLNIRYNMRLRPEMLAMIQKQVENIPERGKVAKEGQSTSLIVG